MNTPQTRPLSPHLQVYRLPMAALMSISHRITGVILSGGFLLVAAMLVSAAMGRQYFNDVMSLAMTPVGMFVLVGWSLALYYHTLNGIRHLIWDTKVDTISMKKATISGWVVLVATVLLTAATWHFAS